VYPRIGSMLADLILPWERRALAPPGAPLNARPHRSWWGILQDAQLTFGRCVNISVVSVVNPAKMTSPAVAKMPKTQDGLCLLTDYPTCDHGFRTHLSLAMDGRVPRSVEPAEAGEAIAVPEVGGLQHPDERRAA
jgi:hypothetical protein